MHYYTSNLIKLAMIHFQELRTPCIIKWVSFNFSQNHLRSSKTPFLHTGSIHIAQNPRFYRRKRTVETEERENLDETSTFDGKNVCRISQAARAEAQAALLDYLHCTRNLQFMDAENMSTNSPHFLDEILKKVNDEVDIGSSITRFLRYHPINEFEPFFESLGLKPSDYIPLLPRNLMFLSDDDLLLENYYVLCNYGIARNKIGKIYKEATEVFQYDYGVLLSKLQAYEELGLSKTTIIKVIGSSPYLLIGDVNSAFVKVLEKLKSVGIEYGWIEEHLAEKNSYNWRQLQGLLCLFSQMGCSNEQLGGLISQHPGLLFEGSGSNTFSLIGLLLKFGSKMNEIGLMFLQFPQVQVGKFVWNLRQGFLFLKEIEMEAEEYGRIVRSHPLLLGSCVLKKTNSLLVKLHIGKKQLCGIIKKNPQELKNWVLGSRVEPIPNSVENLRSQMQKTKFLLDLGFVKNSNEMQKALKVFRGRGGQYLERFACFVKAGLDGGDALKMIKVAPQVLNQSKEVIESKIDFLVNGLGYPISSLVTFPAYLSYKIPRIKLRTSMYNWLKDQGTVEPRLSLCTIIASTDKKFLRRYVNHHPRGPQVWQDLKKQLYVLCNYGIARNKIGKIYKEAPEVFQYDYGVLLSKLQAYEELGLSKTTIIKVIASSPYLLIRDVNSSFMKVLEKLKSVGIEYGWIEEHLVEKNSYNWRQLQGLLCLFSQMGCSEEQLGGLINQHPGLLFEGSGSKTFSLIGLLLKFGSKMNEIRLMFLQFPQVQVEKFVWNLRQGFIFLKEIRMETEEFGRIVRSHPLLLGSCVLKKTETLLDKLHIGKKRICGIIKENPQELKNWVLGSRVEPIPNSGEDLRSRVQKTKFLLDLGFAKNSSEMQKALKVFRGRGGELQERFDCFVKAGLDREDVSKMIKVAPQVISQSKEVIESKIDFLVNGLGYPISSLVTFPTYLSYKIQRIKLRTSMYNWLKDQGTVEPGLSLSTIIAYTDKKFLRRYVNHHPRGSQVWQDLKKQLYSM